MPGHSGRLDVGPLLSAHRGWSAAVPASGDAHVPADRAVALQRDLRRCRGVRTVQGPPLTSARARQQRCRGPPAEVRLQGHPLLLLGEAVIRGPLHATSRCPAGSGRRLEDRTAVPEGRLLERPVRPAGVHPPALHLPALLGAVWRVCVLDLRERPPTPVPLGLTSRRLDAARRRRRESWSKSAHPAPPVVAHPRRPCAL
jgi:hypothetical protein